MTSEASRAGATRLFAVLALAMAAVVTASNVLVQHPVQAYGLGDYLTYGAFTYPFAFLVTDLANRLLGPRLARRVALVGFAFAVALSIWLATPRIAIASGTAFLAAQLVDIAIFHRLRNRTWWVPPLASTIVASAVDTFLFFGLAFHCGPLFGGSIDGALASLGVANTCEGLPWVTLGLADYAVKLALAILALAPYGAIVPRRPSRSHQPVSSNSSSTVR